MKKPIPRTAKSAGRIRIAVLTRYAVRTFGRYEERHNTAKGRENSIRILIVFRRVRKPLIDTLNGKSA